MLDLPLNPNTKKPANGFVIAKQPSNIDGSNIVVIALLNSSNRKTGSMMQTYILVDNGKNPMENNRSGADYSICGNCEHKGIATNKDSGYADKRSCYVSLFQGPYAVYKSYLKGNYPDISGSHKLISEVGRNANIRIGSYGDPLAVNRKVWLSLIKYKKMHTGYTHQHDMATDDDYKYLMASASSSNHSKFKIARTFTVIPVNGIAPKNSVMCPASQESKSHGKVSCNSCGLCSGNLSNSTKSVYIHAHGALKNRVV